MLQRQPQEQRQALQPVRVQQQELEQQRVREQQVPWREQVQEQELLLFCRKQPGQQPTTKQPGATSS